MGGKRGRRDDDDVEETKQRSGRNRDGGRKEEFEGDGGRVVLIPSFIAYASCKSRLNEPRKRRLRTTRNGCHRRKIMQPTTTRTMT
jgi:hypothetical protein